MTTAKNRALDVLRRERTARTFAPELTRQLETEWTLAPTVEEEFGSVAVKDDELRMMFSCCSPRLAEEAQVCPNTPQPLWVQHGGNYERICKHQASTYRLETSQ